MKQLTFILLFLSLFSCVSNTEHQKIIDENNELRAELFEVQDNYDSRIQALESELNDLKFGIPNLLEKVNGFLELEDYYNAKLTIETLMNKHPNAVETSEAKLLLPGVNEEISWERAVTTNNLADVEAYLIKYPDGKYKKEALTKEKEIRKKLDDDAFQLALDGNTIQSLNRYLEKYPEGNHVYEAKRQVRVLEKELELQAYENAKNRNSVYAWEQFLEDYPNNSNRRDIEKEIIKLEVENILGDRNTGSLPNSSRNSFTYSESSSIEIYNNTGYELTVRYSGPTIKKVTIPRGMTKTVYLSSGAYRVAATANGMNYGGSENLSGDYNVEYYITTQSSYRY